MPNQTPKLSLSDARLALALMSKGEPTLTEMRRIERLQEYLRNPLKVWDVYAEN